MKQSKSALCVLLAGTLWGSMGLFVRKLNAVGLYALDIVQLRIAISLVLVGLYLLILRATSCACGCAICGALPERASSACFCSPGAIFPACRRQV